MKSIINALVLLVILASCTTKKERATDATPREDIAVGDTVYLASTVKYVFTKMSDEGDFVTPERTVTTHINLDANGQRVWSTYEPLQPFTFVLNQVPMIDGFKEVIVRMRQGDRMMAVIPSHLGYGPRGNGPIPPNALLHFDIEVISVQ